LRNELFIRHLKPQLPTATSAQTYPGIIHHNVYTNKWIHQIFKNPKSKVASAYEVHDHILDVVTIDQKSEPSRISFSVCIFYKHSES